VQEPTGPDIAPAVNGATPPARGNPDTRNALLESALRVLDQKNFTEVTVDDIVCEAGLARGTFYIYFKDKYDILAALARRLNDELFARSHIEIDRHAPAYDRIRSSLRQVIATWEQHGPFFRSMTQVSLSRPDFLKLNQELRRPFIDQIRHDLESSIERGHAKPIDPRVAAKALAAMMDWFCLLWFGLDEPPYAGAENDTDHVADELALLWYRTVYGTDPKGLHQMSGQHTFVAFAGSRLSIDGH
jgi:AcrR family transcriptional regulator